MTLSLETQASSADTDTLHTRLQAQSLVDIRARVTETVRKQPSNVRERWLLFQLLCIDGEWERALKQLQTWAKLEPEGETRAQLYRGLIKSEMFRTEVFAGTRTPGFIDAPSAWVEKLIEANIQLGKGNVAAADALRIEALDAAPASAGESPTLGAFQWLTDSDSRLGPVCEMAVAGGYRWIPFDRIRSLVLTPVGILTDLIWRSATVTLHDATVLKGYLPSRYPGSELGADALKLARQTTWTDVGDTNVIALGQKTWTTDQGDWGLMELTECRFGAIDHEPA